MNDAQFEAVDAELLAQSNKILLNRKGAYAQDGDRLANFKETGAMVGLTPEKVCEVYLYKALTAMLKILHGAPAIGETRLERFGDVLNYVRLAYGLVCEREPGTPTPPQRTLSETMQLGFDLERTTGRVGQTLRRQAQNRFVD